MESHTEFVTCQKFSRSKLFSVRLVIRDVLRFSDRLGVWHSVLMLRSSREILGLSTAFDECGDL